MIGGNIDGTSGNGEATQVFNFLAVVANPEVYADKLRTLMQATEEHKKFLALVAPADEILAIRKKIEVDKAEAEKILHDAKNGANKLISDADVQAKAVIAEAKEQASKTSAAAKKVERDAAQKHAAAVDSENSVRAALAAAQEKQKLLDQRTAEADNARVEYEQLKASQEALKADLIAMHKRHLQELSL